MAVVRENRVGARAEDYRRPTGADPDFDSGGDAGHCPIGVPLPRDRRAMHAESDVDGRTYTTGSPAVREVTQQARGTVVAIGRLSGHWRRPAREAGPREFEACAPTTVVIVDAKRGGPASTRVSSFGHDATGERPPGRNLKRRPLCANRSAKESRRTQNEGG